MNADYKAMTAREEHRCDNMPDNVHVDKMFGGKSAVICVESIEPAEWKAMTCLYQVRFCPYCGAKVVDEC